MRKLKDVSNPPILWRYFLEVPENKLEFQSERDYVTKTVMKINSDTRMIPVGTDALSPAPHHDIYSVEDLSQLIYAIKETTDYKKPVSVKIAAVHNVADRLCNLLTAWGHEIQEVLGSLGINAIESLRGSRERLCGVGLNQEALDILGIKHAGIGQ